MHLGMEGFDAAVEAFGRASVVADVDASEAGLTEFGGGASSGEELNILGGKIGAEFDDAAFVRDGDEGTGDGNDVRLSS